MRIRRQQPNLVDVDMTPMIDIVFQLIAFFMIVTNFEQTQADERVKLPADELARPPVSPREDEIVLNIGFLRDEEGHRLDPDPFVFLGEDQVRVLDYGPRLNLEARVAKAKGTDPATMTVVIRADNEVPTGLVQELIKLGQESGFVNFALKAKAKALDQ